MNTQNLIIAYSSYTMNFITISEAATLTGKTLITIRRLTKKPTSKSYVKLEEGKLYIDKEHVLSIYNHVTTQEATQPTQPKSEKRTQQHNPLDTHLLIQSLKEQYENRIQDLKEALQNKEKEIERISILFDQQQKIEMARASMLPARTNDYQEAETVNLEQKLTTEPPISAQETQEAPSEKKRRWWQW